MSSKISEGGSWSEKLFEDLSDPQKSLQQIAVDSNSVQYLSLLESMILIRGVEVKLAEARQSGMIGGPVHLSIGQEAIPVGLSHWIHAEDRVYSAHRSHGHLIALGSDIRSLFAEVLGKDSGLCGGRGGSMHLLDQSVGFGGSVPIMAGTVPLAAGAALSFKLAGSSNVAISYLGDGAVEEGIVHETFNLAANLNLPIVFVVENNQYASHLHTGYLCEPFAYHSAAAIFICRTVC